MRGTLLPARLSCGLVSFLSLALAARGQAPENAQSRRLLNEARGRAERIDIAVGNPGRQPKLVATPVLKYTDAPRNIELATLWVWQDLGQPVALSKVEAHRAEPAPRWMYCFASLTPEPVEAKWPSNAPFQSTGPGVTWAALKGPTPHDRPGEQVRQMKGLFKRFTATTVDDLNKARELRPLARPLYEYTAPERGVLKGVLCGFVADGDNPDVVVLLEAFHPPGGTDVVDTWRYAVVGMTSFGIDVKLDNRTVFKRAFAAAGGSHGNWAYFWEGAK